MEVLALRLSSVCAADLWQVQFQEVLELVRHLSLRHSIDLLQCVCSAAEGHEGDQLDHPAEPIHIGNSLLHSICLLLQLIETCDLEQ